MSGSQTPQSPQPCQFPSDPRIASRNPRSATSSQSDATTIKIPRQTVCGSLLIRRTCGGLFMHFPSVLPPNSSASLPMTIISMPHPVLPITLIPPGQTSVWLPPRYHGNVNIVNTTVAMISCRSQCLADGSDVRGPIRRKQPLLETIAQQSAPRGAFWCGDTAASIRVQANREITESVAEADDSWCEKTLPNPLSKIPQTTNKHQLRLATPIYSRKSTLAVQFRP